ncbi:3-oxoacyl-[acyl-carrier-protein] synthase, mitochondrial isoform X2 [Lingula anatina]|nr:3-oxoacyl-[acyl-carrier-protein] synthase, mitochondrial isoform X2 [Lingula anatina]XP_023932239.1 3-oxoacyl-[acyl-carrier-protein] synthase, mitochondrial isoform X2 [Lingula anatina]|eukprot:XP_023932238.1 3-oxoacyl-[acyl-carrier-protein] synthase, mitochondrial isoform X2 [Lingula anatina]
MLQPRRVVVTGLGLVTCLGCGTAHVWERVIKGHCGLTKLDGKEFAGIPSQVAGRVPIGSGPGELNVEDIASSRERRSMAQATLYALAAASEALADANWKPETDKERQRTGVAVGVGMVSMEEIHEAGALLSDGKYSKIKPHFIPRILVNMSAGHISLRHGLKGPNHAVSTACSTGLHALGDASRFIQYGDADVMVCGGTEASLYPLAVAGFAKMRALSTNFNDTPAKASRPFDKSRDGFVMSEGAGIVVLEDYEHAVNRGAKMYAEVLGYGLSGDAYHISSPSEDGTGARSCMGNAIKNAYLTPKDVTYINAHATSTPLGDAVEARAISELFGPECQHLSVSSSKGAIGHLLGAAGSVEAILTILAINKGILPPTLNLEDPEPVGTFNHIRESQDWKQGPGRRIALTNSFGFGGTNCSLCLGELV